MSGYLSMPGTVADIQQELNKYLWAGGEVQAIEPSKHEALSSNAAKRVYLINVNK
jgi:hypothetical protein